MSSKKILRISAGLLEAHRALPEEWDAAIHPFEAHRAKAKGPLVLDLLGKSLVEVRLDEAGNLYLALRED